LISFVSEPPQLDAIFSVLVIRFSSFFRNIVSVLVIIIFSACRWRHTSSRSPRIGHVWYFGPLREGNVEC